eukprot:9667087-Lingulodinium_polyedra.AAC.1
MRATQRVLATPLCANSRWPPFLPGCGGPTARTLQPKHPGWPRCGPLGPRKRHSLKRGVQAQ